MDNQNEDSALNVIPDEDSKKHVCPRYKFGAMSVYSTGLALDLLDRQHDKFYRANQCCCLSEFYNRGIFAGGVNAEKMLPKEFVQEARQIRKNARMVVRAEMDALIFEIEETVIRATYHPNECRGNLNTKTAHVKCRKLIMECVTEATGYRSENESDLNVIADDQSENESCPIAMRHVDNGDTPSFDSTERRILELLHDDDYIDGLLQHSPPQITREIIASEVAAIRSDIEKTVCKIEGWYRSRLERFKEATQAECRALLSAHSIP